MSDKYYEMALAEVRDTVETDTPENEIRDAAQLLATIYRCAGDSDAE